MEPPGGAPCAFYRPLFSLWLLVVDTFGGLSPWFWHLSSMLLHVACTYLVYRLSKRLIGSEVGAGVAAALFAVHPIHVDAVTWVSASNELLLAFAYVNVELVTTNKRPAANDLPLWLSKLDREVISCIRCPRLVEYRQMIAREKRRAYLDWDYWGKPVPGFGDPDARVLVLGLAPGAHGSNRTGRPFTGDASGKFMYPILYETGFANQPDATRRDDGLELKDLYITAAARCAPPDNKPLPQELANCSSYLDREMEGLKNLRVVVALGKIAFDAYLNYLKRRGQLASRKEYVFRHGVRYAMPDGKTLLASYHPSNQNTQTGKLTRQMFMQIFKEAAQLADERT